MMLRSGEAIRPVLSIEEVRALACAFLESFQHERPAASVCVTEVEHSSSSTSAISQSSVEEPISVDRPSRGSNELHVRVERELSGYEDRNFLLALGAGGPDGGLVASGCRQRVVLKIANLLDSQSPEIFGAHQTSQLLSALIVNRRACTLTLQSTTSYGIRVRLTVHLNIATVHFSQCA